MWERRLESVRAVLSGRYLARFVFVFTTLFVITVIYTSYFRLRSRFESHSKVVIDPTETLLRRSRQPLLGWIQKTVVRDDLPPYFYTFDGNVTKEEAVKSYMFGATCTVSDVYQFIFVAQHKSACTTVRSFLAEQICAHVKNPEDCTSPLYSKADLHFMTNRTTAYIPCKTVPIWKFEEYLVFTIVRNSWSRAVSSYEYCGLANGNSSISWKQFCANPDIAGRCYHDRAPPPERKPRPEQHWAGQLKRVCAASSCVVDYIGTTANLEGSVNEVIAEVNARKKQGLKSLRYMPAGIMYNRLRRRPVDYTMWYSSGAQVDTPLDSSVQREPSCRGRVARFYKDDIAAFGFKFGEP